MRVHPADNPESVRARKYLTGTHLALAAGGVEVGATPSRPVWREGSATLLAYDPAKPRHDVPVVLVYPLLLRPFLLDLVPERSLVRYLRDAGFQVYLLHWDGPGGLRRDLDGYLGDVSDGARAAAEDAGSGAVSIIGHCQAGSFAAVHAALDPQTVRNLVLYAAPVRGVPVTPPRPPVRLPDRLVPTVPLDRIGRAAGLLARAQLRVPGMRAFGERFRDRLARTEEGRVWLAACRWVDESGPVPGPASAQWARALYRDDALVRGTMTVGGRRARLDDVTARVLVFAGQWDIIAPAFQAAVARQFPSAREFVRLDVPAGHVGVHVGPTAPAKVWRPLAEWLGADR
jgi:polyhydroxyalkanoate synthase